MADYTPVDYTPEFTDDQKASAISIRPSNPALQNPSGNLSYAPVDHVPEFADDQPAVAHTAPPVDKPSVLDRLFGLNGTERFQFWPEKLVRSALEAPQKALRGELSPVPTEDDPSGTKREIAAAQDLSNLVGVGAPSAMAGGMKLGAAGGKMIQPAPEAPIFYSAVEHTIQNARQPQASGEQWLGALMNSPGVKQEELEWTGVADFLAARQAEGKPVTKQELQNFIGQNKVEVQSQIPRGGEDEHAYGTYAESVHDLLEGGGLKPKLEKIDGEWHLVAEERIGGEEGNRLHVFGKYGNEKDAKDGLKMIKEDIKNGDYESLNDWAYSAADNAGWHNAGPTGQRYAQYQLPGGENYSEMILTLPETKTPTGSGKYVWRLTGPNGQERSFFGDKDRAPKEAKDFFESLPEGDRNKWEVDTFKDDGSRGNPNFQSSHWDEPNILAHVRFNDRIIDGKKTLFLEEIQSDWHQQGRESGYKGKVDPNDLEVKPYKYGSKGDWLVSRIGEKNKEPLVVRAKNEKEAKQFFIDKVAVPDAPFKKTWPELVLKRMLKKAADEGYEQIAWTPGKVQNERYPGRPKEDEAGMAKFYDEILPNVANKLGKKFGAKVGEGQLDLPHRHSAKEIFGGKTKPGPISEQVHTLPITPELAQTATGKGFPLFSSGLPFMFTPVDHNPFEEDHR